MEDVRLVAFIEQRPQNQECSDIVEQSADFTNMNHRRASAPDISLNDITSHKTAPLLGSGQVIYFLRAFTCFL